MNSTHDKGENGMPLDKDLDEISRAYAQLEAEEPPELLDLAIRNSARRAVGKKPRRIKFGWVHGLTTAAVFVLALSVIIHQRENQPTIGSGLHFERPQPGPISSPDKKQSPAATSGQVQHKLEKTADAGTGLAEPAATAPVGEAKDQALGNALRESRQKTAAAPVQQSAAADSNEDQVILDKAVEETEADNRTLERMAVATEDVARDATAKPAVVTPPPPAEAEARSDTDVKAEEELQAIISMKRNGDESWKAALKAFIEDHPGYPLPDELKN